MNLDGWEIDVETLPGPKRGVSPVSYFTDAIFPSLDGARAVVLYSITEIRLGWEVGMVALFADQDNPRLILNPRHFLCCYTEDAIIWLSNELFAAKKYYYDSAASKIHVPFALIDIARNRYSFLPLSNIYPYGLAFDQSGFRLVERDRDDRLPSDDGPYYAITDLVWYDLNDLDQFDARYAKHLAQ